MHERPEIFQKTTDIVILISLLGFVPVLAYPMQKLLPSFKAKGREAQRNLAFVLNFLGYCVAFLWAVCTNASSEVKLICSTYFISVLLLTICNKLIHYRASGHASSFSGPIVLLAYLVGAKSIIPCIIFAILIIWASVLLKRHTMKEILGGIFVCIISFIVSLLFSVLM